MNAEALLLRYEEKREKTAETFANARLAIFSIGAASAVFGALNREWRTEAEVVVFVSFVGFLALVLIHLGVKENLSRIRRRLELERHLLAIRALDWVKIPALSEIPAGVELPAYADDLDLFGAHSLFRLLNHTISTSGLRTLVARFADHAITDEDLGQRQRKTKALIRHRLWRRRFLVAARTDQGWIESEKLKALVAEEPLVKPGALPALAAYSALFVLFWGLVLGAVYGHLKSYFLFVALAEFLLYSALGKKIDVTQAYDLAQSLSVTLGRLERVFRVLERAAGVSDPDLRDLLSGFRAPASPTRWIRRLDRALGALGVRQNYLVHALVNLIVPWDFLWTLRLEKVRLALAGALPGWLEAHAEFETCLSLAEYRDCFPADSFPEILAATNPTFLSAEGLRHPLIPSAQAIGNDVLLSRDQKCVLITGSNMSGKSTYLRSVGVAMLLARAGTVVAARRFHFQNVRLATSLRRQDSLEDGFSSFYAEVRQLKTVLELSHSGPVLYLIDEVLRGTNNRERLAGSRYFLAELLKTPAFGFVTTHDLELASLEADHRDLRNFHFGDEIIGNRMIFHYRIHPGACTTTNALRVMNLAGIAVPLEV